MTSAVEQDISSEACAHALFEGTSNNQLYVMTETQSLGIMERRMQKHSQTTEPAD